MKWFKSKATKRAEKEQAQQAALDSIQQQIDDAGKCEDVADRFLKLDGIKEAIDTLTGAQTGEINKNSKNKFHLTYLGVGSGTTAAVMAAAVTLHFPPAIFFFLMFPGILTGTWAGQKRVEHEQKKLMAENKPFFDALIGKRDIAAAGADAILKNDLNALAASERFTEIVEKAPRVRDHFTAAFAREIAKRETPVPQPKQPKPGFKL